jgi:hypothetical protein
MSEENKKNATERLEDLENTMSQVMQAIQPVELMARDLMAMKEALKLLNNKLDAAVKAVNQGGPITDETLSNFMTENNAKDLADKVAQMVSNGILVASDTVSKESFVVINEADASGKVVNPRMQFLLSQLNHEEVRTKLEGAKVGSNISVGDQGASINVLESYNVASAPQPASSAAAPEAPASEAPAPASEEPAASSEAAPSESSASAASA